MLLVVRLLVLAALVGVGVATSSACAIGLTAGTATWCGFPIVWPVAALIAIPIAVLFGVPADWLFRKLGFQRWWHFLLGGVLLALPVWYELAAPFESARWQSSGFFDTVNFIGSGAIGGLAYWWLRVARANRAL